MTPLATVLSSMGKLLISSRFVTWSFRHGYFCVTNWPVADGERCCGRTRSNHGYHAVCAGRQIVG